MDSARDSKSSRLYIPRKHKVPTRANVALLIVTGIIVGWMGSEYNWFAIVHEWGHAFGAWMAGGTVHGIEWTSILTSGFRTQAHYRFMIASGVVFELLVFIGLTWWATIKGRPFIAGLSCAHFMHTASVFSLSGDWPKLQPAFHTAFNMITPIIWIQGIFFLFAFGSWAICHAAYKPPLRTARA